MEGKNFDKFKIDQIKNNVISDLKNLSLLKKDRDLLLKLIELFDILTEKEENKFLNKLQKLIEESKNVDDLELEARIYSLKSQLNEKNYLEIRHFPHFSIYFKKEKIEFYPKKTPLKWEELINELKKIEFETGNLIVYKTISKKNKILELSFKKKDIDTKVIKTLISNVFTNIKISLYLKKENL